MKEDKFMKSFLNFLTEALNEPAIRRKIHYLIHKKDSEDAWFIKIWKSSKNKEGQK